jgi:hypothetical protein
MAPGPLDILCPEVQGFARIQNSFFLNHIKGDHKDWEEIMKAKDKQNPSANKKGANVFKWLEWIVLANLPFQFVEHPLTRKNSNLESITEETIKNYLIWRNV